MECTVAKSRQIGNFVFRKRIMRSSQLGNSLHPRASSNTNTSLICDEDVARDTQITKKNRARRIDILKAKRAAKIDDISNANVASQENQLVAYFYSDHPANSPSTTESPPTSPPDVNAIEATRNSEVEELLRRFDVRLPEVEALGCRHSRALRKSVSTVEGIQHQSREFGQLATHVEENGKRLIEIEEALSGLHGFQATARLFNVRLEKIETYLDQVGHQGTTACQHDFDSRRSHELCNSLNTLTKKPCNLSSAIVHILSTVNHFKYKPKPKKRA
ncbi:hypothetical protein AeMF1_016058 [Aphanomyces euteiches]|nr:hypothetical protein AeMF1_016058 [Aphanomyces euteiches]